MSVEFRKDENGLVGTFGSYYFVDVSETISLRDQLLAAFPLETPKPADDTVPMRRLTKEQAEHLRDNIRSLRTGETFATYQDGDGHGQTTSVLDEVLSAIAYCLAGGEEP